MDSSQEVTIGRFSWRRVVAGDYLAAKETANVSELSRNVLFFFFIGVETEKGVRLYQCHSWDCFFKC